jgi:hypothetical protein
MRKLKALKIRGVQREEKKGKKMRLVSWKAYFYSCYFFITPFPLYLKEDF